MTPGEGLAMTVRKFFDKLRMSGYITINGYNGFPFGKSYNPSPPLKKGD